jgi:hypothetical protein
MEETWRIIMSSEDAAGDAPAGVGGTSTSSSPAAASGAAGAGAIGKSKTWGDIGKIAGQVAGVAGGIGILITAMKRSKIFSTFMDNLLTILGAIIDMLLIPLIPLFLPLLQLMMPLMPLYNSVGKLIMSVIAPFMPLLVAAVKIVAGIVDLLVKGISLFLGPLIDLALKPMVMGAKIIGEGVGIVINWLKGIASSVNFDDIGAWFINNLINPIISLIKGITDWLNRTFGTNIQMASPVPAGKQATPITINIKMPSGQVASQTFKLSGDNAMDLDALLVANMAYNS